MTPGLTSALGSLAAVLVGCSSVPAAPGPFGAVPAASPSPAVAAPVVPPRADAAFGAIEAVRTPTEKAILFQRGIDPATKNYGLGQSHYVTVAGREFAVHYRYAATVAALKVGETVNLHPSGWVMCVEAPDGTRSCAELFNVFKGRREQPPLGSF